MIYTPLTNKAMRIAYAAHQGQMDKCGQPYIFHPYHLADLAHNSNQSRFAGCEEISADYLRYLREKYAKAIAILNEKE